MGRRYSTFTNGNPPLDTDIFTFGRVDPTSPYGYSNFHVTWAEIVAAIGGGGGGGGSFEDLTSGENTTATMVVGTGAILGTSGSGEIIATEVDVGGITGLGAGVATALGLDAASVPGALMLLDGDGGTPSIIVLANAYGLPVGGIDATGTPDSTTFLRGDGTWNTPAGGSGDITLIQRSGVPFSTPADLNNNIMLTVPIAAGTMFENGIIRHFGRAVVSANPNLKTLRIYIGAAGAGVGGTLIATLALGSATNGAWIVTVSNSGVVNVQETTVIGGAIGQSLQTRVAGAIDTSADWELVVAMQKATAGDTTTLQHSFTELISDGT